MERFVLYGGGGAGIGNGGGAVAYDVGRFVPDTIWPVGSEVPAASSKVSVTRLSAFWPPHLDMRNVFFPAGETSNTSRSTGPVWFRFVSVAVSLLTCPPRPLTLMMDGK